MELKKESLNHKSGGLSNVTAFGLDASSASTIIGMLTRQYSDPEMAFIRETSSNAYDAHIAAGTEETPFDIHIPTPFAPHVEIRDYGTGLSKEFMLNKYTQVGHSTKRSSNKQIGGFGIGRLSFLIVTEQAAITSYHNGMKASYTVNYDEEGQLLISLTDERPSDEPNGLRLKFPVQTNRVQAFRVAAEKYFSRVSATLPNFSGDKLEITPPDYSYKTDKWGIRKNGDHNIVYAVMGNIAYPVRTDTLKYDKKFNEVRSLLDSRLDLFFDIGEVIPVPTRENLDMCDQTINGLLNALTNAKQELVNTLQRDIVGAPNRWVAYKAWDAMYSAASYEFKPVLQGLKLTYKGENVNQLKFHFENILKVVPHPNSVGVTDKNHKDFGRTMTLKELTFHSRRESNWNSSNTVSWSKGYHRVDSNHAKYLTHLFIYNDTKRGIRPIIDHNYPNASTRIELVSGTVEAWDKFVAREIERGMNPKAFRLASTLLPKPKVAKVKPTNIQIDYINTVGTNNPNGVLWGSYCSYQDIGNFTGKQYYVKASNFEVTPADSDLYRKLIQFISLGLLNPIKVIVINKKNVEHIQDDWKPLQEYVKVDRRLVNRKKAEVREALYLSMKRAHIYSTLSEHFSESRLIHTRRYWNDYTKSRVTAKTLTPLGNLFKDSRDVYLAVSDMRYLVNKLNTRLTVLGANKPLTEFVSQVQRRYGWIDENTYRTLAESYDLDFEALKTAATADSRGINKILDYLKSQVYYVVSVLGNNTQFNLKTLTKELTQ